MIVNKLSKAIESFKIGNILPNYLYGYLYEEKCLINVFRKLLYDKYNRILLLNFLFIPTKLCKYLERNLKMCIIFIGHCKLT